MRVFKNAWFERFARKQGISDAVLLEAVERAFFMYGYAKSAMGNLAEDEELLFKKAAGHVLNLSDEHLSKLVVRGEFLEVFAHDKEISK